LHFMLFGNCGGSSAEIAWGTRNGCPTRVARAENRGSLGPGFNAGSIPHPTRGDIHLIYRDLDMASTIGMAAGADDFGLVRDPFTMGAAILRAVGGHTATGGVCAFFGVSHSRPLPEAWIAPGVPVAHSMPEFRAR
jgi:hypothetical protein